MTIRRCAHRQQGSLVWPPVLLCFVRVVVLGLFVWRLKMVWCLMAVVFRQYNPKEVMIMRELATQRPRGFGFITFATQKDMDWAIRDMHNTRIDGRVVTVSKARPFERPRGDRSPRRQGSPERRPSSRRDGGDWTRDYPRRYQPHSDGYNGQRSFHDTRRRSYEPPMASRRYSRDDPHSANQMYSHSHYDNR